MILLDTNILAYAAGDEHPLREPSQRIFAAIIAGQLRATTSVEVIQEFLHVSARRRDRGYASAAARDFISLLAPLALPETSDAEIAVTIFESRPRLDAADALLAAMSLRLDVDALVTADRAFLEIPELRVLDPRSPEIARMLA